MLDIPHDEYFRSTLLPLVAHGDGHILAVAVSLLLALLTGRCVAWYQISTLQCLQRRMLPLKRSVSRSWTSVRPASTALGGCWEELKKERAKLMPQTSMCRVGPQPIYS